MMGAVYLLAACVCSGSGFAWMASVNAKRRRAFRLAPKPPASSLAKVLMAVFVILPGVLLLVIDDISGFVIWFSLLSLLGWFVALRKPVVKGDNQPRLN